MKKIFTILGVSAAMFASAQTNLLVNPGFETWTDTSMKPDGWNSMNGGSVETTIKHSGNNSIKLIPVNITTNANIGASDVNATANTDYTVGYWVLDNVTNSRGRHWVQFRTDTANITVTNSPFQPSTYTADSPAWTFMTASATSPAGTTKLRFDYRVYAQNSIASDPIYLDDVVMVQGVLAAGEVTASKHRLIKNSIVTSDLTFATKSAVQIYDMNGKLVKSADVQDDTKINVSALPKGTYMVKGMANGAPTVQKFIKQ